MGSGQRLMTVPPGTLRRRSNAPTGTQVCRHPVLWEIVGGAGAIPSNISAQVARQPGLGEARWRGFPQHKEHVLQAEEIL